MQHMLTLLYWRNKRIYLSIEVYSNVPILRPSFELITNGLNSESVLIVITNWNRWNKAAFDSEPV